MLKPLRNAKATCETPFNIAKTKKDDHRAVSLFPQPSHRSAFPHPILTVQLRFAMQAIDAIQNTTRRRIVARALVVPRLQRVAHGLQHGDFLV